MARDGFEIREEYDAEEEARRKESKLKPVLHCTSAHQVSISSTL